MPINHGFPFIYLNNAATSWPKPHSVLKSIEESLSRPFSGGGRGIGISEDYVYCARESVSRLFKITETDHIIFTHNATDALNILIQGFTSGTDSRFHVLSSDLEHNSVLRPLNELSRKNLLDVTYVQQTGGYIRPDKILEVITPDTRLAVMTHGSNVTGSVQDIESIGRIMQDNDIFFIVDGAQTAGHISIGLDTLPVDAFVFTGHKGLFGVPGTGGFYIRDPGRVKPVRYGGTGSDSSFLYQPEELPERYEAGTPNYPGLAALIAGISFVETVGTHEIEQKGRRQTSKIVKILQENELISLYNYKPDIPIISLNISGMDNDDIGFILAKLYRIIVRTGLHCAPKIHSMLDGGTGSVRLSLSWFTTDEECRIAAEALLEISEKCE